MSFREISRGLLVLIVTLVLQLTVALEVQIDGAHPELMIGLAVVAGLVGGAERGAVVGFCSGVAIDLFLPTPFGLSALVGTLVGAAAGQLASLGVDRSHPLFLPVAAAAGSAIGVIMFAVVGTVLGQPGMLTAGAAVATVVVAVSNGILSYPMRAACRWALGQERSGSAWRGTLVSGEGS